MALFHRRFAGRGALTSIQHGGTACQLFTMENCHIEEPWDGYTLTHLEDEPEETTLTITKQCVCVTEESDCTRSYAKQRMLAQPKCYFCGGRGLATIDVSHEPPPVPLPNCDWNATVDGCEETGPVGYGSTKQAAVDDLLIRMVEVSN